VGSPNDPQGTDPSLLGRLCTPSNNEAAWAAFLRRYQPALLGWCRRLGLQEADAEDVCQSVLASLAQKLPVFRYDPAQGSFRGWLRTTVGNAVRNFWRGRARRPGDVGTGDSDVAGLLEQAEAAGDVESLVGEMDRRLTDDFLLAQMAIERVRPKVKDTTWQAFALTALEGVPGPEVAARLAIPVAHVYVYKDRVCKLLRQAVADLQGQPTPEQEPPP
jgi:RNA polymerase sigma-70 factor (ECF subfamily)